MSLGIFLFTLSDMDGNGVQVWVFYLSLLRYRAYSQWVPRCVVCTICMHATGSIDRLGFYLADAIVRYFSIPILLSSFKSLLPTLCL